MGFYFFRQQSENLRVVFQFAEITAIPFKINRFSPDRLEFVAALKNICVLSSLEAGYIIFRK
jgi:hypothetical protein